MVVLTGQNSAGMGCLVVVDGTVVTAHSAAADAIASADTRKQEYSWFACAVMLFPPRRLKLWFLTLVLLLLHRRAHEGRSRDKTPHRVCRCLTDTFMWAGQTAIRIHSIKAGFL
jgi:hypothetical protein